MVIQNTQSVILGRLEALASENKEDHAAIKQILYGNGQPGLMSRLMSMDNDIANITKQQNVNTKAIGDLTESISVLNETVKTHHEDKTTHSLIGLSFKNRAFVWIMIAFIAFHSVISFIPDVSGLLKWLAKLVGIPIP